MEVEELGFWVMTSEANEVYVFVLLQNFQANTFYAEIYFLNIWSLVIFSHLFFALFSTKLLRPIRMLSPE